MSTDSTELDLGRSRDEQAVRDLGYRFSDACNRDDGEEFRTLWTEDGIWIIDDPINIHCAGADLIENTRRTLRSQWDFFVQLPHAPVVFVDGDRASSRWTVSEHAGNRGTGRRYFNYARYDDELLRTPDGWRYARRHYRYYHLDQTPESVDSKGKPHVGLRP